MTFDEEYEKFKHIVNSTFTQIVNSTFKDVKENMILAVEQHSLLIALCLMGATIAILVIGTLYVWCFHHPSKSERSRSNKNKAEKKLSNESGPKENNSTQEDKSEAKEKPVVETLVNDVKADKVIRESVEAEEVVKTNFKQSPSKIPDIRKRIPSNSEKENNEKVNNEKVNNEKINNEKMNIEKVNNEKMNNNESPGSGKSRIPVFRSTSRTKQS